MERHIQFQGGGEDEGELLDASEAYYEGPVDPPPSEISEPKKEISVGDIVIPPNFLPGECGPVGANLDESQSQELDCIPEAGLGVNLTDVIAGGYRNKFLYPYGSKISGSSDAKRKSFVAFLRTSGILKMISNFIIDLQEMEDKPPPEKAMELMLKVMGSKLPFRDILTQMVDYRDETKMRLEELQKESEELRMRLEEHEPVTRYEALDPEEHLKKEELADPQIKNSVASILPETVEGEVHTKHSKATKFNLIKGKDKEHNHNKGSHESIEVIKKDERGAKKNIRKSQKNHSNKAPQLVIEVELEAEVVPQSNVDEVPKKEELTDLDVEGLSRHFANLLVKDEKGRGSKKGLKNDCSSLPPIPIPEQENVGELKLPPLEITKLRRYTKGTKIFKLPLN